MAGEYVHKGPGKRPTTKCARCKFEETRIAALRFSTRKKPPAGHVHGSSGASSSDGAQGVDVGEQKYSVAVICDVIEALWGVSSHAQKTYLANRAAAVVLACLPTQAPRNRPCAGDVICSRIACYGALADLVERLEVEWSKVDYSAVTCVSSWEARSKRADKQLTKLRTRVMAIVEAFVKRHTKTTSFVAN